ncbi:MAG: FAD-dependent oxidoreductase [Nocardioidaceae bacterium]
MRILVAGAGVTGLTCATTLAERGHEVHVVARDLPLETTSAVAAAWWYPHLAMPYDRVTRWARRTYEVLAGLSDSVDSVRMRRSYEVFGSRQPDPWWVDAVPGLDRMTDLPPGYVDGWSFDSPVAETDRYLPYLRGRLEAAGATLTRMALPALPSGADAVVNAAGLANRALVGDLDLYPVRGQVVRVASCGVEQVWLDQGGPDGPTYVVPRAHDVVVGGTQETGRWARDPDPGTAERILRRAGELVPELRDAAVLGHRVGLRPARPEVRLELERRPGASPVVHCYGHGGAGVTLSWGCAEEVADLVESTD